MSKFTIEEFARSVGVSPTTVSRALSGRGRVGQATREMILERARRHGYVPSPHAQHLATGRSRMVVLQASGVEAEFMLQIATGVQRRLADAGYGLLLDMGSGWDDDPRLLWHWTATGVVCGTIVITGTVRGPHGLSDLAARQAPLVTVGYPPRAQGDWIRSVVWDLADGARQVASRLVEWGHRRVGAIDIGHDDPVVTGLREVLESLGAALPSECVRTPARLDPTGGAEAAARLLSLAVPPTAIVARNDLLAVGALREARRRGLHVPRDLSIVGHDDLPVAQYTDPMLTTVRLDCVRMGEAAAAMLLSTLGGEPAACTQRVIACASFVERESAGPCPAARS